jgi:hypothetical protein
MQQHIKPILIQRSLERDKTRATTSTKIDSRTLGSETRGTFRNAGKSFWTSQLCGNAPIVAFLTEDSSPIRNLPAGTTEAAFLG